jgi:hypothetical protein
MCTLGRAMYSSISFWGLWHHLVLKLASHVLGVRTVCSVQTLVTDSARLYGYNPHDIMNLDHCETPDFVWTNPLKLPNFEDP